MNARRKFFAIWSRRLHRWGTVVVLAPFLIILVTGILLQWKKHAGWIQPPEQRGTAAEAAPGISFDDLLRAARSAAPAGISTWADVDRMDVRPDKGIAKVLSRHEGWEVQIDLETGAVLHVAQRRSDVIEAIHDGSWFHEEVKLWVFFPVALVMVGLYVTGLYLFYLPYGTRWARSAKSPRRTTPGPPKTRRAHLPES